MFCHLQAAFEVFKRYALGEKYKQLRRELGRDVSELLEMWSKLEKVAANPELYATIPVKIASNGHRPIITFTDPQATAPLRLKDTNALLVIPLDFHSQPTEVGNNAS